MATVTYTGKKRIQSNSGTVQLNLNDDRILHYDDTTYRFVVGKKSETENKVLLSKLDENVLTL